MGPAVALDLAGSILGAGLLVLAGLLALSWLPEPDEYARTTRNLISFLWRLYGRS